MKGKLTLFVLALLIHITGCSIQHPITVPPPSIRPIFDHSITLTWQQSFVNNNACSTTVTTSCISGFNEGYMQGTTQIQLHNDIPTVCTGTTQPEPCSSTFNGLLPIGNVTFYVVTTFLDQAGVAGVTSSALSPPVLVKADPAQNVNAVINN
jgi:hypothetical protein